jgi:hypothetical protein
MGYTHYWRINSSFDVNKFADFSSDCKKIAEMSGVLLGNGFGEENSEPKFSKETVCFNGIGENSHETFIVDVKDMGFQFCKTNMKPYDKVVVACLLCLEYYFDCVKVSSDGDNDDWADGTVLFNSVFPNRKI